MWGGTPFHRALHFSRGETADGRWAAVRADPHPALGDAVRLYQGFSGVAPRPLRRRELPFGNIVLILNFGPRYRMIDRATGAAETRGSFIAGLHESYALVDNGCIDRCLHVDLSPVAAYRLLRTPMVALKERTVELGDLIGREADRLLDRLHDAGDWQARFAMLDSWLLESLARTSPGSPEVAWAWRRIESRRGAVKIAEIATALDWSRKRLVAGFREQVGIPPKTLGRVLRFHHALELLSDGAGPAAEIAHTCGYADQAHMIREFRAVSGLTPGAMARRGWPQSDSVAEA